MHRLSRVVQVGLGEPQQSFGAEQPPLPVLGIHHPVGVDEQQVPGSDKDGLTLKGGGKCHI